MVFHPQRCAWAVLELLALSVHHVEISLASRALPIVPLLTVLQPAPSVLLNLESVIAFAASIVTGFLASFDHALAGLEFVDLLAVCAVAPLVPDATLNHLFTFIVRGEIESAGAAGAAIVVIGHTVSNLTVFAHQSERLNTFLAWISFLHNADTPEDSVLQARVVDQAETFLAVDADS